MSDTDSHIRWERAIDLMRRAGDHAHLPLMEAGRDGLMDIVAVSSRTASIPFVRMRRATRPLVVLLGDDDETPTGPDGWRCAVQITQWACGAIVHGSGAKREHYDLAVRATVICQRFLIVETASQHVAAWMGLLRHVQALAIIPSTGDHPVEQRSTVH